MSSNGIEAPTYHWDFLTGPLRNYYRAEYLELHPENRELERRFERTGLLELATDTPILLYGGSLELRGRSYIDYQYGVITKAAKPIISWLAIHRHPDYGVTPAAFTLDGQPFGGVVFLLPPMLSERGLKTTYAGINLLWDISNYNKFANMGKIPGGRQIPLPIALLSQMTLYNMIVMDQVKRDKRNINRY